MVQQRQPPASARVVRGVIDKSARLPSRSIALAQCARAWLTYAVGLSGFLFVPSLGLRLAFLPVMGFAMARLFGIGHEALHRNFTGNPRLDWGIGYLAMLPTLHPMGPVTRGHVRLHHGFTNVKGRDPQWCPLSKAEFDRLSRIGRALERAYRSVFGFGLYWSVEIVLRGLLLLRSRGAVDPDPTASRFHRDRAVTASFVVFSIAGWGLWGYRAGPGATIAILGGFVVPLAIAHWLIGMTTYFQHTSPRIAWYRHPDDCTFFDNQVTGTNRLMARGWLRSIITGARPHSAHHVDMRVPAIHLRAAQQAIDAAFPGAVPTFTLSLESILDTTRRCKLYDYDKHQWTTFAGEPSSPGDREPSSVSRGRRSASATHDCR